MDAIVEVALISTAAVVVSNSMTYLLTRRAQKSTIASTEATTEKVEADTQTVNLDNYNKLYGMYKDMSFDFAKLLDIQRKSDLHVNDQQNEIFELKRDNNSLKDQLSVAITRAESAESKVGVLEQKVKEYPEDVKRLKEIIDRLEGEVSRLTKLAGVNAEARILESKERSAATGVPEIQAPVSHSLPPDATIAEIDSAKDEINSAQTAVDDKSNKEK